MTPVFLDFETFWSVQHCLEKLGPFEYVTHPDTELISVAYKVGSAPTEVVFGEDNIRMCLRDLNWSDAWAVAHNMSGFDALILSWRLGIRPKMWGCTLAMARPIHAKTTGLSLAALVKHYGIGVKDNRILLATKGKHLADFTPEELAQMRQYNAEDTEHCAALFYKLLPEYNALELWHVHAKIQSLVASPLELDTALLEAALSVERSQKHKALMDLARELHLEDMPWGNNGAVIERVRAELASAPKFAALLETHGVPVPMKPSPTNPEKCIPALAKTDEGMQALQDDPNPVVAHAARVRLQIKSTLTETRLQAFLDAAKFTGGKFPIPAHYCGADTTGRGSGWHYNCMTAGHEVLTPQGWVDIVAWQPDTPIMQWWPNGRLSWCTNPGKVVRPSDGVIVKISAPLIKGEFTRDHRLVAVRGGRVVERTAGWLAEHSGLDGMVAAGMYEDGGSPLTPDQVRLIVAFSADGCETAQGPRWGFRKQRKIERLRTLLDACGVPFREFDYRSRPGGHCAITVRKLARPAWLKKGFGPWILALSPSALDALLDELKFWDGCSHSGSGQTCFYTSKEDQAGWISTAAALRGIATKTYKGATSEAPFIVYFRQNVTTSVESSRHVSVVVDDREVYCPQVTSTYVLVRFGGAIHVTGNCYNLPKINKRRPRVSDALRRSIRAPKGHVIVVADMSGIELRFNHTLWKVPYSTQLWQQTPTADIYRAYMAQKLGCAPEEVTDDQRFNAKVECLGLGYGMGAAKYQFTARVQAAAYGKELNLTLAEAQVAVDGWRKLHPEIRQGWYRCHDALEWIAAGKELAIDERGLFVTCREGIRLPSGRIIRYPNLRQEPGADGRMEWIYGDGRHKARIYGGKVDENIVQGGARDVFYEALFDIYKQTGVSHVHEVYDEGVWIVPEAQATDFLDEVHSRLRKAPTWFTDLVTWSEGAVGVCYADAK